MRSERIAKRWNLKSRAKAGRHLLNWQDRLNASAHLLYQAGVMDERMGLAKKKEQA
jgi:hypothetical protein